MRPAKGPEGWQILAVAAAKLGHPHEYRLPSAVLGLVEEWRA